MNRITVISRLFIAFFIGMVFMTSCGGSNSGSYNNSADSSSVKGPAPDNNSATNPSSADTNYQKDTGRQLHDSTTPAH